MNKIQRYSSQLLYRSALQLGEGAYWSERLGKFLFVDILGKKTGIIDLESNEVSFYATGEYVGTVVTDTDSNLVTAQKGKIVHIDLNTKEETILTEVESGLGNNRSNDGKCDPAGRLWFGTMDMHALPGKGNLYSYDGRDLVLRIFRASIPNGICWSPGKQTMYYIDSAFRNIQAFDYDIHTGNITNPRVIVSIPEGEGVPDGMTIDRIGNLWVAMWGGGCVRCYDPYTGEMLAEVSVEAPLVSSCALGGKNGNQLLITTARDGMTNEELKKYPLSGSLFMARVGAKKAEVYEFKSVV